MTDRNRIIGLCGAVLVAVTFIFSSGTQAKEAPVAKKSEAKAPAKKVQRFGAVIGVKAEKLEYYKKLHANTWPSIVKAVQDAGIGNVTIFLTTMDDGKHYLFHY